MFSVRIFKKKWIFIKKIVTLYNFEQRNMELTSANEREDSGKKKEAFRLAQLNKKKRQAESQAEDDVKPHKADDADRKGSSKERQDNKRSSDDDVKPHKPDDADHKDSSKERQEKKKRSSFRSSRSRSRSIHRPVQHHRQRSRDRPDRQTDRQTDRGQDGDRGSVRDRERYNERDRSRDRERGKQRDERGRHVYSERGRDRDSDRCRDRDRGYNQTQRPENESFRCGGKQCKASSTPWHVELNKRISSIRDMRELCGLISTHAAEMNHINVAR
jgi:hypothetical protein